MPDWFFQPEAWVALATLTTLEIVLGIDNIVFLSILAGRLPEEQRQKARIIGLAVAMGTRILLLLAIQWVMQLTKPLFTVLGHTFSGQALILLIGGLFLLVKGTTEIHHALERAGESPHAIREKAKNTFGIILMQIVLMDVIFSLDSVVTAVAMARQFFAIMIIAIIIAVLVMMLFAKPLGDFIELHPSVKMLALSFLILIGVTLVAESFHVVIPKPYIYFSMAFSISVEMLNLAAQKRRERTRLKQVAAPHPPKG